MTRLSTYFLPTVKEAPADADTGPADPEERLAEEEER